MPSLTPSTKPDYYTLHGNSFNPDTGQLTDYIELSMCSEGALWIQACKDKFGHLVCQGHGPVMPTGTDTLFFIPITTLPKGKKATYLKIVINPKKQIRIAYASLLAATALIILATSAPKLPISLPSKPSSTASFLHPTRDS